MLYKAFAAVTLIAAPIIVLIVQSFAPQAPVQPAAAPMAVPPPVISAQPQPPPMPAPMAPSAPAPDTAAFGQPMPDAGKPFLSPGNGLPGGPAPIAGDNGDSVTDANPDSPS